ncbi:VOC family protein [Phenylobacterium sp.]|uniref:VOC family protein n=1 Tax=Phenylobacterium sp. TaxID=1871053 RepID=UPI0039C9A982
METDDLDSLVEQLRGKNATFRSDIIQGAGGRQILLEDPSGNLIELFEPPRQA